MRIIAIVLLLALTVTAHAEKLSKEQKLISKVSYTHIPQMLAIMKVNSGECMEGLAVIRTKSSNVAGDIEEHLELTGANAWTLMSMKTYFDLPPKTRFHFVPLVCPDLAEPAETAESVIS